MTLHRLPPELVGIILEYTGWLQEEFKRCSSGHVATYEENRRWFHKHQSPTSFALRYIAQHAWWNIPVCATQLDANYEQIVSDYLNLTASISRSDLSESFRVDSLNLALPISQRYSTLESYALKTYYLVQDGVPNTANLAACPSVAHMLQHLPLCRCRLGSAAFYVLARGTVVPPTFGHTNCTLQVHFPLDIERLAGGACGGGVRVGSETRHYELGRSMCFDDSFVHTICAGRSKRGVVAQSPLVLLVLDLWHPELFTLGLLPTLACMFHPANRSIFHPYRNAVSKAALQGRPTSCTGAVIDRKPVTCSRMMALKLVFTGDRGTGKSSLLQLCSGNPITDDIYYYEYLTFEVSSCTTRGIPVKHVLWRYNEPPMYHSAPGVPFRYADCILITFDVTRRSTYEHAIGRHLNQVVQESNLETSVPRRGNTSVVLIGTHIDTIDADRQVSSSEVWSHIRSLDPPHIAGYFEVCTRATPEVNSDPNVRRTKIGSAAVCAALDDMINAITRYTLNRMSVTEAILKFGIAPNKPKDNGSKCTLM